MQHQLKTEGQDDILASFAGEFFNVKREFSEFFKILQTNPT